MSTRPALALAAGVLLTASLAACGSSGSSTSGSGSSGSSGSSASAGSSASMSSSGGSRTLTVLAASSLTNAFGQLQSEFQKAHPGVTVRISYEASSDAVQQVNQGAPADVVALADTQTLAMISKSHLVGKDAIFARNRLEIATPPGNPGKVTGLADLAKSSVDVVVCAPQVPCGKGAAAVLAANHITAHIVSQEQNVRTTLIKVEQGDAQAAMVYHSDVVAAGSKVEGVVIPNSQNETQEYPIQAVSTNTLAAQWISLVTSAKGQQVLHRWGFLKP